MILSEPIVLPVAVTPNGRPFHRRGMGYEWDVTEHGVLLRADYLSARGHDLTAEIEVLVNGKHAYLSRHTLSNITSRKTLWEHLGQRSKTVPWPELVERFCVGVIRKEREGEPVERVGGGAVGDTRYLIDKLAIKDKPNLLYGPGGGAKGYLAVTCCVGVAIGRGIADLSLARGVPLYLDWEDDRHTMGERLSRVANGMGIEAPTIAYKRMGRRLPEQVNEVAKAITDQEATFVVVDSMSAAMGMSGETLRWDEAAGQFFDALTQMPTVTWLIIGHVNAEGTRDLARKAFGSIQIMNRVRVAWEMRSETDREAAVVRSTLHHTKYNHTRWHPPFGLTFTFDDAAVHITSGVAAAPKQTRADRLAEYFAEHGSASTRALSLALRDQENAIRATLSQHADRFARDDAGMWDLATVGTKEDLPW